MRVTEANEPSYDRGRHYHDQSPFPSRWVTHPEAPQGNTFDAISVVNYAVDFSVPTDCVARVHVSADERYVLALDGDRIGRGPERGDRDHWSFETYDLPLTAGPHRLTARVHSLGRHRPYAQVSVRPAFLLMAEGPLATTLSTGVAAWTATRVDGYSPLPVTLPKAFVATGCRFRIDGSAASAASIPVAVIDAGPLVLASMRMESPGQWQLVPAYLPPMIEKAVPPPVLRRLEGSDDWAGWRHFLSSAASLQIPANTRVTAVLDFADYYCVYSRLTVASGGGATVRLAFAEALFEADGFTKAQRDRVDGLTFVGMADELLCPGSPHTFEPPWWTAGRYVELSIVTGAEPLRLQALQFMETRYPVTWDSDLTLDDPATIALLPIARRAIEVCSHETYYDCPYYEQLMYVGDARLEALVTYTHSVDDRLPRKAVRLFDQSRTPDGWTQARTPTKTSQVIPPFSLWWVAMVHDLAFWRDRPDDVAARMPGVRAVMEAAYAHAAGDGLYRPTTGWHFVDWAEGWAGGVPTGGADRPVAPIHFQCAYAAKLAAELEDIAGEPLLAERHRDLHAVMLAAGRDAFFDADRAAFFDDASHTSLSEHAQAMAILAGAVIEPSELTRVADTLIGATGLRRATIYYTHYVFEAYRVPGRVDPMFDRLRLWSGLVERGFKTTFEQPEPTRSDCHGWGAHPLFHFFATVLGIRPAAAGFGVVRIQPQLGPLNHIRGRMVHPRGFIEVEVTRKAGGLAVSVDLPPGVHGTLHVNGGVTSI